MIINISRADGLTYSRDGTQVSLPDLRPVNQWTQHLDGLLVGAFYIAVIMRDGVEVMASLEAQARTSAQMIQFDFLEPFAHEGRMFGVCFYRLTEKGRLPIQVTGVRTLPDGSWEPVL